MTPKPIPETPRRLFDIQVPLGFQTEKVCTTGHAVSFRHVQTGNQYVPLAINGQMACAVCLAATVGLSCVRPHKSFEVCDA